MAKVDEKTRQAKPSSFEGQYSRDFADSRDFAGPRSSSSRSPSRRRRSDGCSSSSLPAISPVSSSSALAAWGQEDPAATCVFKHVHWKPPGGAPNQPVTFCFDLKREELRVDSEDARVACFPFDLVTMSIESREDDMRRKVVVQPWQNSFLREQQRGAGAGAESEPPSPRSPGGPSAGPRATSSGGRDESGLVTDPQEGSPASRRATSSGGRDESEVVMDLDEPETSKSITRKSSNGSIWSSRTATTNAGMDESIWSSRTATTMPGGGEKTAWIFFVAIPDLAALSVTARDAGIVQTSFNATWRIEDYCESGGCADVYRAKGEGDIQAAVKIPKQPLSSKTQEDAEKTWSTLMNEMRAMRALQQSPHVPKLYGSFLIRTMEGDATALHLSLVQEYLPISLASVRLSGPLSELESRPLLGDILRGLEFMHSHSYAHRDIKLGNIMMRDRAGPAVIIDYGFASKVSKDVKPKTIAGTPGYLAPELFRKAHWDLRPADIFSLACLAHNLVSNVPMFAGRNAKEVLELNRMGMPVLRNLRNLRLEITYEFVKLLKDLLNPDVQQRRTATRALESKWFRLQASSLMRQELCEGGCKWALQQRALGDITLAEDRADCGTETFEEEASLSETFPLQALPEEASASKEAELHLATEGFMHNAELQFCNEKHLEVEFDAEPPEIYELLGKPSDCGSPGSTESTNAGTTDPLLIPMDGESRQRGRSRHRRWGNTIQKKILESLRAAAESARKAKHSWLGGMGWSRGFEVSMSTRQLPDLDALSTAVPSEYHEMDRYRSRSTSGVSPSGRSRRKEPFSSEPRAPSVAELRGGSRAGSSGPERRGRFQSVTAPTIPDLHLHDPEAESPRSPTGRGGSKEAPKSRPSFWRRILAQQRSPHDRDASRGEPGPDSTHNPFSRAPVPPEPEVARRAEPGVVPHRVAKPATPAPAAGGRRRKVKVPADEAGGAMAA